MSALLAGDPERLASGDLTRTSVDDVMAVVAASRQGLCVVFGRGGEISGRLIVKSGMLLEVEGPDGAVGLPALASLRRGPHETYDVYRVQVPAGAQPLGVLAEVWAGAVASKPKNRRLFRGRFADVSLSELMAVLSVSRQKLGVAFWRDRELVGSLVAKAGQILEAELASRPGLGAKEALDALLADPGERFTVVELRKPRRRSGEPIADFFSISPPGTSRELLRTGSTARTSLGGLLAQLSQELRPVRLLLRRAGEVVGEVVVHDAQAWWAHTASGATGREAFVKLGRAYPKKGTTYELYRTDEPVEHCLGSLVDLLADVRGPPADKPRRVLSASLEQVPLADLVAMLSVSRRRLGVVLFRDREPIGGWVVKGGQVLDAVVLGHTLPSADAFEVLRRDPGSHCVVIEVRQEPDPERRVGMLEELWDPPPPSIPPDESEDTEVIVAGRLEETPLFTVLTSLSLSRQHLVVEVLVGTLRIGTIAVRASQVLEVTHQSGYEGAEALSRLLTSATADRFRVLRRRDTVDAEPIGTLEELLGDLARELEQSGPRLVVPGEPEIRAWMASAPPQPMDWPEPVSTTTTTAQAEVEELGRRVSTLQLILVMQAVTMGLLTVALLWLVLAAYR